MTETTGDGTSLTPKHCGSYAKHEPHWWRVEFMGPRFQCNGAKPKYEYDYRDQPEAREKICSVCMGRVDDEGESVGECSWVQPAVCDECGGCLCDGSC